VLVVRSSTLLWAYVQCLLLHTPVSINALQSFVQVKSGSGRISTLVCAKGQEVPLEHAPMRWNLHILVLLKCHVLAESLSVAPTAPFPAAHIGGSVHIMMENKAKWTNYAA